MAIASVGVGTSATSIYAVPNGQETAVTTMFFCNTSGSDIILSSLNLVLNAGSAGSSNQILKDLTIPAGETFTFETEKIILGSQDFVSAQATATGITATVCTLRVS
jgi:hypothetical protein